MLPAAERWACVRELLGQALELDPPAQRIFLDSIEDSLLRDEVKSYLAWLPPEADAFEQEP
ncbi:MAG: hypothetical protein JWP63_6015 [Candidatus Solibacter sp.]|jgi:hypothetical protein|nr:hypothetical protein [Candidatus Solibacter sp.]